MKDYLIFEQPLNKRIRMLMRLDSLFKQYSFFSKAKRNWDSIAAVSILNDIVAFIGRSDIKTEVIKELERQSNNLRSHLENNQVNQKKLLKILDDLETYLKNLYTISGNIGQELNNNIILNASKLKSALPGNSNEFDSPLLFHWINKDSTTRCESLEEWFLPFRTLQQAVSIILDLIRESGSTKEIVAESGFYQDTLNTNRPYQLIRVGVLKDSIYFPEISAGKHRFSIRFMNYNNYNNNPEQNMDDISFMLCTCAI